MTALGIVAAVLALIGVQAVAFSQTGQTPDAFQPAPAAATTTPEADLSSDAADSPSTEDLQSEDAQTQEATSPAAMPSITGSSLDDDDESGEDSEGEELESGDDD